jgi:hypothetical protein
MGSMVEQIGGLLGGKARCHRPLVVGEDGNRHRYIGMDLLFYSEEKVHVLVRGAGGEAAFTLEGGRKVEENRRAVSWADDRRRWLSGKALERSDENLAFHQHRLKETDAKLPEEIRGH